MQKADRIVIQASVVAIEGRALAIEGPVGSGKSSLALALIERGAVLIGDDAVSLSRINDAILATPPPNIAGLIEVHGVGLIEMPVAPPSPLALILSLTENAERLPEHVPTCDILGCNIPCLPFVPGSIAPAERAKWALGFHGLKSA